MRYVALILMLILPNFGAAMSKPEWANWTYSDLPPIQVELLDDATGGCWTNIGEVKTYAEDKLRLAGASVLDSTGNNYSPVANGKAALFALTVKAERHEYGFCWGAIDIKLVKFIKDGNINGTFSYAYTRFTNMRAKNFNNDVLDIVGEIVETWGK